jgi:hypothetical protein
MGEFGTLLGTVAMAIIGLAIVSVIISPNAQTGSVIQAASAGFAQDLQAATSPVSGGSSVNNFATSGFNPSSSLGGLHL